MYTSNDKFYIALNVNHMVTLKAIASILLNVSSHKVTTSCIEPHYSPDNNALCNINYPANF